MKHFIPESWFLNLYICFIIFYTVVGKPAEIIDDPLISSDEMGRSVTISTTNSPEYDTGDYYGNLSLETIHKIQKCDRNLDLMELCMRCAKVTKSPIVYPMCCDDEENVGRWCHDYVNFGL